MSLSGIETRFLDCPAVQLVGHCACSADAVSACVSEVVLGKYLVIAREDVARELHNEELRTWYS